MALGIGQTMARERKALSLNLLQHQGPSTL